MKLERRFVKDELGATLALAMMMIVIIGIMGAGLLTFVTRDMNSVIEENRGQRALELADAGVAAAKSQLTSSCAGDPNCGSLYNGNADGVTDIRWSKWYAGAAACSDPDPGGMTLTGLQSSATTPNDVRVTIEYRLATRDFRVISTGCYGVAKRRVEAILKGVVAFGGGAGGYPLYYTPSNIKIEATTANPVLLRDISVFAGGDILLPGLDRAGFKTEMGGNNNSGILTSTGKSDSLQDWCTTLACNTKAFQRIPSYWNTQERKENKTIYNNQNSSQDLLEPGLAAVGRICGYPAGAAGNSIGACANSPTPASIADGVYGYDCSTGPIPQFETGWKGCPVAQDSRGNGKTFVDKDPEDKQQNATDTITFPFPRPEPIPETLHQDAHATYTCPASMPPENPCSPPWDTLIAGRSDIVFIDANKSTVDYQSGGNNSGILVVWCGSLVQKSKFQGVIMNLNGKFSNGDGASFGGTNCTDTTTGGPDMTQGTFRNQGQTFSGWLYAEGGTSTRAGIEIAPGSNIEKFPGGKWSFETEALANVPPNAFTVQGWRELYK
jgi:Tfp pilus assembly protein PilX